MLQKPKQTREVKLKADEKARQGRSMHSHTKLFPVKVQNDCHHDLGKVLAERGDIWCAFLIRLQKQ